ncbi:hypothetical protein ABS735_03855 [Streptomyces sp. MMCC 100]|uniref:hypothetical protein n=1 Tax=Streptomyces sp. MMCC 100 TaxID=3163555 RepID=UPI003595C116
MVRCLASTADAVAVFETSILLPAHPATCDAVAELLGCTREWVAPGESAAASGVALPAVHPAACDAVAGLLGCDDGWAADGGSSARGALLTARHPAVAAAWEAVLARG